MPSPPTSAATATPTPRPPPPPTPCSTLLVTSSRSSTNLVKTRQDNHHFTFVTPCSPLTGSVPVCEPPILADRSAAQPTSGDSAPLLFDEMSVRMPATFCSRMAGAGVGDERDGPKQSFAGRLPHHLVVECLIPQDDHFPLPGALLGRKTKIGFQEFKNKLLEPGLVEHIVVSNKLVTKVYVKNSPQINNQTPDNDTHTHAPGTDNSVGPIGSHYKFHFNIGSMDLFELKLQEAQETFGIDSHDYVHVTYVSEVNWFQELIRFSPSFFLVGLFYLVGRGIHAGIFNIGKDHVTKTDKNSKNKILFKDVAGCDEAKQEIMEFVHFLKNPKKYEVSWGYIQTRSIANTILKFLSISM